MSYFSYFGNTFFEIEPGVLVSVNNITKFATITKKYRDNPNLSLDYVIKDGDRPELISNRIYGTVQYWWVVLLMNSISNVYEEWPLDDEQLTKYMDIKYPNNSLSDIHHYEDIMGDWSDPTAISLSKGISAKTAAEIYNLTPVSIYEYEKNVNDSKRYIKLVDPDYVDGLVREMKEAFA